MFKCERMCEWEHCENIAEDSAASELIQAKQLAAKPRISLAVLTSFEATETSNLTRFESILWAPNVLITWLRNLVSATGACVDAHARSHVTAVSPSPGMRKLKHM